MSLLLFAHVTLVLIVHLAMIEGASHHVHVDVLLFAL